MAEILKTLIPGGGGDYTLMSTAEATDQQDLVAGGNTYVLDCYAGTITDNCTWTGWTTSATNDITIRAADGEGHDGVVGDGFIITQFAEVTLTISQNYVNMIGFTVLCQARTTLSANNSFLFADRMIFRNQGNSSGRFAYSHNNVANDNTVRNCLMLAEALGPALYLNNQGTAGTAPSTYQGCTFITVADSAYCLQINNSTSIEFSDCSFLSTTGFGAIDPRNPLTGVLRNNAVSDATGLGTDPQINLSTADFEDYAGGVYVPAVGSKLDGTGTTLSFPDDIAGVTRTDPWDIGAYAIAGGPPIGVQDMNVNIGGEWKSAAPHVLVGGVWKPADAYVLVGGEWKPVYEQ